MNRPMAGRASTASPYAVNPHQTAQHRPYQVVSGPVRRVPVSASAQALHAESSTSIRYAQPPPGYKIGNRFDLSEIKRSNEKSKGLRHFSSKVCEKVKEKGRTNYNEVADELVHEYFETQALHINDEKNQYDMKNIRRRVYDALNVLLAMNIIEKNKKDIHWVGLPTSSAQEMKRLEEDKVRKMERIKEKSETLQEMIMQLVAYKTLVDKNREIERLV
ncbi:hypothetical protein WR25_08331 [Diploscapter pachys]|uniref:E2F/DP family winged-helix DNA-binding domain-containing protein n=1 Tax=Diploscapter pachys TaxID=2018661 RepID=A0A2A2JTU2_9BILA|nr:hypothetical protein WR25_08331 [Diploscapter pachys]